LEDRHNGHLVRFGSTGLCEHARCIDPAPRADVKELWMVFVAVVQMGNFATRYILGMPNE
jgi:hypothetical protein